MGYERKLIEVDSRYNSKAEKWSEKIGIHVLLLLHIRGTVV